MNTLAALWLLVRRSLRHHAFSTSITILSVALAAGLVMAVFVIDSQTRRAFIGGPVGFDAVLGARGSKLQLVLNTVFHLETSPGNIPWSLYETIRKDPRVELAVPYAVGDNYRGFRIVGVTDELFSSMELEPGRTLRIASGEFFQPLLREAVIGSFVADRTGMRVGSRFNPYHGLSRQESARHEEEYVVVGVLAPTNTPIDRVIWIPIEGIFRMGGHELRGAGERYAPQPGVPIPEQHKEVSAVMLKLRNPDSGFMLDATVNRQGNIATLAWPIGTIMAELFEKIGWVSRVLTLVAYLTVLVAAGSILASIYNTINERRREFAILRALGARRRTLFSAIVLESAAISACGALVGFGVYAGIMSIARHVVRAQTGVVLELLPGEPALLLVPAGITLLGALTGIVPAIKAYSTDVAANLNPST